MKSINVYLNFDGNCREAMQFYAKCLDAELQLMTFAEAPFDAPKEAKDRILHAKLTKGPVVLMASDTMPGMAHHPGNNFSVSIDCDNAQEVDKLFAAIGDKGKVTMPVQHTFWNAHFGMVVDKFGVAWMFHYDKPKK